MPPEIVIEYPQIDKDNFINVLENQYEVLIKGHIKDKSNIESIKINGVEALYNVEDFNPELMQKLFLTRSNRKCC